MKIISLCLGAITGTEVTAGTGDDGDEIEGSGCNVLTATARGVEAGAQEVRKSINSKKLTVNLELILFCKAMTSLGAEFFPIVGYSSVRVINGTFFLRQL
jgi:hypothetical protein